MTVDPEARKAIVYAMQKIVYDNFYYTQLVERVAIDAHVQERGRASSPELSGYSKLYYTSPHQP